MPAGALAGWCPACLLAQGAETKTAEQKEFEPPSLAEVARLFPQLEILGALGAGGMGAVYKARQPGLDRTVALKVLPAGKAGGPNFAERFNREARALAKLSHPNIVGVHEFGQAGALSFFIMEFVDGANLRQLERAGRLSPREALQIIPQICDALQYAHDEGVVHRDIKPENVLVDRKGRVKIADFGLAKILGREPESLRLTAEGQVMGTPHYMAPEQLARPLAVDHRADIYSLGVVFYEMLTGDLPLGKFAPPSRKVQVDVRLDEVVLRALENDPARRYQHASEVKSNIETIVGEPHSAVAAGPEAGARCFLWAGFPLVVERGGARRLNRAAALRALAVIFGLLMLGFGLVSVVASHSLRGWEDTVAWPSAAARAIIATLLLAWGVRQAFRRSPAEGPPPQTESTEHPERRLEPAAVGAKGPPHPAQGTALLSRSRFSRKAVVGICWALFLFIAVLFPAIPAQIMGQGASAGGAHTPWWQILLAATILPLGLTAPFGTTILGWSALRDIRCSAGRMSGRGLAALEGLLFPLLGLDVCLIWVSLCVVDYLWLTRHASGQSVRVGPPEGLMSLGAVVVCAVVDILVCRKVWRAVRAPAEGGRASWPLPEFQWWGAPRWRFGDWVLLGLVCAPMLAAPANPRFQPGTFENPAAQPARRNPETGILEAKLPIRGTAEVVAISDYDAPANEWWRPDGTPIPDTLLELGGGISFAKPDLRSFKVRDMVVRCRDLPDGVSWPSLEIETARGSMARITDLLLRAAGLSCLIGPVQGAGFGAGTGVVSDGGEMSGGWFVRASLPPSSRVATLRLGFGLEPWQTSSTHDRNGNQSSSTFRLGLLDFQAMAHQVSENAGHAAITMLLSKETPDWSVRVIATDTNGVEHPSVSGSGTAFERSMIWTYTFSDLPLAKVQDFRVQVRPVHWVEFRNVALEPSERSRLGKSPRPFKPTGFGQTREVDLTGLLEFGTGRTGFSPVATNGTGVSGGTGRDLVWGLNHGFDAEAETNGLRLFQVGIADAANAEWETLTPRDLTERLSQGQYGPRRLPSGPGTGLPATYIFRGRNRVTGLLQILSVAQDKAVVRLRYKIIERGHFE